MNAPVNSPVNSSSPSHFRFAVVLAMTTALGPLAIDTYLPAFPAIAESLGSTVHAVSLSIAVYIGALAIGQLVAGPLSDRCGRQQVMLVGLGIFAFASLMLTQVASVWELLLLRALQAFGGGWAIVGVPALVRDRLSGQEAARFFSLIGLIMMAAPALAPSLGTLLLELLGWRSIFAMLGVYALMQMVMLRLVVFKGGAEVPTGEPVPALRRYLQVLAVPQALRFLLLQSLAFSVMLLFISHASFIYQEHFGASPTQFSMLFGSNIVLMLVINLINRWLLKSVTSVVVLRAALSMQAAGIVLLILVLVFAPSLWLFLPAMMITVGALGGVGSNTQACFMEYFPQNAGTAAALMGAGQFAIAGGIAALSSLLPASVLYIVLAQGACSVLCLLLIWTVKSDPHAHQS
ncbi:multidrug effflux MFS transporter [Pseudomaricurvus sp. HS19]|uniref:multidrug effflux MFS transporter n=1 Tax=Pseudomaricurvus sp. HS19 TaxID=2692626 RepID=UPI0019289DC8